MPKYATLAQVRAYQGLLAGETADDTLLTDLLNRVEAMLERDTGRTFSSVTATKTFDERALDGALLVLSHDLLSVTTLTDANGTVLTASLWDLLEDTAPYWAIVRTDGARWSANARAGLRISVAGTWGYSASAPDDVVQACVEATCYLFQKRQSVTESERALVSPDGTILQAATLPSSYRLAVRRYSKAI
jgi:hypothetical protein